MAKKSLMYNHPKVYDLILKFLHGSSLKDRYKIISLEIGTNKKVIDVGCGTGKFAQFLDKTCEYNGIDLNEKFAEHAKNKGLNIKIGNLMDEKNYSSCDVTVICDVLHHVVPNDKKLVEICRNVSKKTIICEPFTKDCFFNVISGKFQNSRLFHNLLGEADGVNTFEDMKEWIALDRDDIIMLMESYGAKRTITVGGDVIGIIENNRIPPKSTNKNFIS